MLERTAKAPTNVSYVCNICTVALQDAGGKTQSDAPVPNWLKHCSFPAASTYPGKNNFEITEMTSECVVGPCFFLLSCTTFSQTFLLSHSAHTCWSFTSLFFLFVMKTFTHIFNMTEVIIKHPLPKNIISKSPATCQNKIFRSQPVFQLQKITGKLNIL